MATDKIQTIPQDEHGFLKNSDQWNADIAELLAARESIVLTEMHWSVIHALRDFYREFELSPSMRPLIKYLRLHLGDEYASSIVLMQLFGDSPAKMASKLAGLPKPENCL